MALTRVAAAGAVVRDHQQRLLLVRRGREPGRGRWSLPGGRVESGESPEQAAVREVEEETGLRVVVTGLAGAVERAGPGDVLYEIEDFHAHPEPGADPERLVAGDDALEAAWFALDLLPDLDLVDGLVDALEGWGVLPATPPRPTPPPP